MGLRDIGETLPPGFRFYPSDEELICHYLYKKIANEEVVRGTLVEIDLHTCEPWQLPEVAKLNSNEWYFFSFRDRKYATGYRTNRATTTGYWKATGKDRTVLDPRTQAVFGMRKTLVFYKNRAPNGIKTGWIMHEFRLENHHVPPKEDWVLCRVFHKSRGENGNKLLFSPQNFQDSNTDGVNLDAVLPQSPTNEHALSSGGTYDQNIISFSHSPSHDQNPSSTASLAAAGGLSTPVLDHSSTGCYHLHLSQYHHHDMINESHHHHRPPTTTYNNNLNEVVDHNTKCDDGYGFLFDMMGFEDDSTKGLMPSSFTDDI